MFSSIKYIEYDNDHRCNVYSIYDTCLVNQIITSPYGSPSLSHQSNRLSNTLTLMSIVKHYSMMNRNVALNIAYYYGWLFNDKGYKIDEKFIKQQLDTLNTLPSMNNASKYYHSVMRYVRDNRLLKKSYKPIFDEITFNSYEEDPPPW